MPLYYAHFVIVEENVWPDGVAPEGVMKQEARYWVQTQLFSASDPDHAYLRALEMRNGFSDANHDGPGDATHFRCIGIHDLDEVILHENTLAQALNDVYGIDVGHMAVGVGMPSIPSRDALSLFARPGS